MKMDRASPRKREHGFRSIKVRTPLHNIYIFLYILAHFTKPCRIPWSNNINSKNNINTHHHYHHFIKVAFSPIYS